MTICFGSGICPESDDTIFGGAGDDVILTGSGRDLLLGNGGKDLLVGDTDRDRLIGGDGDDILVGGGIISSFWEVDSELSEEPEGLAIVVGGFSPHPSTLAELLVGGTGDDILIGGSWNDQSEDGFVQSDELNLGSPNLHGFWGGDNILWGGVGDDELYGANGFDTLGGGEGADSLYGYGGVDIIYGGAGDDVIYGGDGDPVTINTGPETSLTLTEELYGGAGFDFINGEGGVDHIFGGAGGDRLHGGDGNDKIWGGDGSDFLHGDAGNDTLTGGADRDYFFYPTDTSTDTITDFNLEEDVIFFADTFEQARIDAYISNATEKTIDGETGLLIEGGGGSIFLIGIGVNDISAIHAEIDVVVTVG